jgi:hypothetical protein
MKTIIQKEPSGCGFACVAMLAGTSYDEMQKKGSIRISQKEPDAVDNDSLVMTS